MLIDAVVLVLRETLEAGVLIPLLVVVATQRGMGYRWLAVALVGGMALAVVYASWLGEISTWFGYTGQERLDATSQFSICATIIALVFLLQREGAATSARRLLRGLLITPVTLATMREAVEIIVFYQGFAHDAHALRLALVSGIIGLAIGVSVGVLAYHAVLAMPAARARRVLVAVISLVGAGMALQATQLLAQADIVPSTLPVWDSSALVSEASVTGQMLYAVFGYESSPSAWELGAYVTTLLLAAGAVLVGANSARGAER